MRPNREQRHPKRRPRPTSPARTARTSTAFPSRPDPSSARSSGGQSTLATSLVDRELVTERDATSTGRALFEDLEIGNGDYANLPSPEPRSFPYSVKQQCWEKAEKVKGRDPDRWRRDPLGNLVFRKLVGCPGCLCHDYDHILPYSKATANRSKGNRTELSKAELVQKSSYCRVSGRDMDLLEMTAYGNVRRGPDSGGCRIQ
ncbi:hypothetical protein Tsubulata_009371 [Turnera subulata]|uniref:HNH domain-containing protein n=1 Tax=Turnera subulata TaxID=218843 RepID=A0A9Q0JHP0_9ROSI|nr:hypothetical protein Tsubulata_009371 [Turnera subulata]